jgi:hypothetical protein
METGEIRRTEPWLATTTVFGGAIRMIHLRLDGVIEQPLTEYYDELIDCMWRGMLPTTGPNPKEQSG